MRWLRPVQDNAMTRFQAAQTAYFGAFSACCGADTQKESQLLRAMLYAFILAAALVLFCS
jgi:hypothetical protein